MDLVGSKMMFRKEMCQIVIELKKLIGELLLKCSLYTVFLISFLYLCV